MGEKAKILIVDDEISQTELLQGFLAKKGFVCTASHDPAEALGLIRREGFDLLISDYRMPKMNGLDLIRSVRELDPEIAMIMMSAYGSIETAVEVIKAGATDFLTK